jgi:hypothetical protein
MESAKEYYKNDDGVMEVKIYEPEETIDFQGEIESQFIILTKATIDTFLKMDNAGDLIALYTFYYYTSKWQKTNQPRSTTGYTAKGLGWSLEKVRKTKKLLKEMGLVEDFKRVDEKGKIEKWYIRMNYKLKRSTENKIIHPTDFPQCGQTHSVANHETNAYSNNNLNSYNNNKLNSLCESINEIYNMYPNKCIISNRALHKGQKDKEKIRALIKKGISIDHLKAILKKYLEDCSAGKIYLKNFSTLLNNLPDYSGSPELPAPDSMAGLKVAEMPPDFDL